MTAVNLAQVQECMNKWEWEPTHIIVHMHVFGTFSMLDVLLLLEFSVLQSGNQPTYRVSSPSFQFLTRNLHL